MPTSVSPLSCLSPACSSAPTTAADRKTRRSNLQRLALGGLALAALATSAVAQSAATPLSVTTDDATVTPTTATMDAGLSAVRVGDATTPDSADRNALTVGAGVRLETTSANVIQVDAGTGNTITNNGTLVANTAGAGVAVVSGDDNVIVNWGTITAGTDGVLVGAGNSATGRVLNNGGAAITAATGDGLHVTGANAGTVSNSSGSITATAGDGIEMTGDNTGTVSVTNGGHITAAQNGLLVGGDNTGTISAFNSSQTTAAAGDGLHLAGANAAGGTISVYNGAMITANAGDGIEIVGSNSGTLTFEAGGVVTGTTSGLTIGGSNTESGEITLANGGSLRSVGGNALTLAGDNAGAIRNGIGGYLSAAGNGIQVGTDNLATGAIENTGTIVAQGSSIYVGGANAGSVANSGSLTAGSYGVLVQGDNLGTGSLSNAGTIADAAEWATGLGVYGSNAGTVSNSGSIEVGSTGIYVGDGNAATGRIENSGTIVSLQDDGINLYGDNAGTIHNTATGSINAQYGGVSVYGANVADAVIRNDGTLTTAWGDGVFLRGTNAGSLVNNGTIEAGGSGLSVRGRIDSGVARLLADSPEDGDTSVVPVPANSAAITNNGRITAAEDGISVTGPSLRVYDFAIAGVSPETPATTDMPPTNGSTGVITNAGTITAGANGISVGSSSGLLKYKVETATPTVANAGLIQNLAGATITAEEDGIALGGENASTGIVRNAGAITAGDNGLVVGSSRVLSSALEAGTTVTANSGLIENAGGGTLAAEALGVLLYGDNAATGRVVNAGIITAEEVGLVLEGNNRGEVTNSGTIEAGTSGIGILRENSGRLDNSGAITAAMVGVGVQGSNAAGGTLLNSGSIAVAAGTGILGYTTNAGAITNTGTITAGVDGINIYGANTGSITSSGASARIEAAGNGISVGYSSMGSITDDDDEGEETPAPENTESLVHTGTIQNLAGSTIEAGADGIHVAGINAGTVLNAGALTAGEHGIFVAGGVTVLPKGAPLGMAADVALPVAANSGTVRNTGSIATREDSGILLSGANAGTVENAAGATIASGYDGMTVDGDNQATGRLLNGANASIDSFFPAIAVIGENAGLIENAGRVSAAALAAVYVAYDNTGTIHNTATGLIDTAPQVDSMPLQGATTTVQRGKRRSGTGIQILGANAAGASVLNEGAILAASYGISVGEDNAGTIVNRGTLGSAAAPVGDSGIYVFGSNTGSVLNSGTITALDGITVVGDNAGTVRNEQGGTITAENGIVLLGDNAAATVLDNAGTIVAARYGMLVEGWEDEDGAKAGGNNAGTITNSGAIEAGQVGLLVNGDSAVLANTGRITAVEGGITVLGDAATTRAGTITTTGEAAVGLAITGDAATIDAAGTITTTGTGIHVEGSVTSGLTNAGTIRTSGPAADGLRVEGTAVIVNRGTITTTGADSVAVNMGGAAQTLINSGALASADVAVASNGDDTVVLAAGASVSGAIAASGLGSTLYFGAAADVVPSGDLLGSRSSAFNLTYGGAASNFNTVFLAGTTNFNGTGVVSTLNTSAILAPATFRANSTVEFTATGSLPTGLALPTTTAAADVALYNLGTLGGNGTVALRTAAGGLGTLVNTGTIAPGNSIGTLTIAGNVHNTGTLAIELGANTSDVLALTGGSAGATATFTFAAGSTVAFSSAGTTPATPGTMFNFMTADSTARIVIEGTPVSTRQLLNATDSLPDYKFFVVGDSDTLSNLSNLYAVVARDHAYEKFATAASQVSVGTYLDAHRADARFANLLLSLDFIPTNADLNAALELMSGELYPSLAVLENERVGALLQGVAANLRPVDTLAPRSEPETFARRWYTFAEATVDSGTADDDKVAAIDTSSSSVLAGVGCAIAPKWDVGGFLNAGDGKAENDHPDKADSTSFDVGVFARYDNAGDYYYGSLAYSTSSFEVRRQASFARAHPWVSQAAARAKGEFDGEQFTAYVEKGFTFKIGRSVLQPYGAVQYSRGSYDRFTETGAGLLNLTVDGDDFSSLRGILGVAWRYEINRTFGVGLRGVWAHEFDDEVALADASFGGTTDFFRLRGLELGADRFNAGLDLHIRLTDKLSASLRGDYATSDGLESRSANVGIRYNW